jgi:hypothetical protein
MLARYRAILTPWRNSTASNIYGTTGGWIGAINSGVNVAGGYLQAADQLLTCGGALNNVPADQVDRLKENYASVELADGSNIHSIETIGTLRRNASQVETTIAGLEQDSLSADPNMNTEITVLNKINAASIIALRKPVYPAAALSRPMRSDVVALWGLDHPARLPWLPSSLEENLFGSEWR